MPKKLVSVLLVFVMLFAFAVPAFATSESNAIDIVATKLWLDDEETKYTVTNEGTYYKVVALDKGISYVFHVQQTDGEATLADFTMPNTEMTFLLLLGFINGIVLKIMSLV